MHTNLNNIFHVTWEPSKRKGRPEELTKLECFDVRLGEKWIVVQKYDRTKGIQAKYNQRGEILQGLFVYILLCIPLSWR